MPRVSVLNGKRIHPHSGLKRPFLVKKFCPMVQTGSAAVPCVKLGIELKKARIAALTGVKGCLFFGLAGRSRRVVEKMPDGQAVLYRDCFGG